MSLFGKFYSQYYELLYRDKNYQLETDYVDTLIKKFKIKTKTILDIGCGTGNHAIKLSDKGYVVHGTDLSQDMIDIALKKITKKVPENITFSCSDIRNLQLHQEFDAITALFHVISYQTSNENLIKTFETVNKHLSDDGIFIFDFWYGPAVLNDLPTVRIKRLENENVKITRLAEPILNTQCNTVDVNYEFFIENAELKEITTESELHIMRYLFDIELEDIVDNAGFDILQKNEWMCNKSPDINSWNVVWIIKKKKY